MLPAPSHIALCVGIGAQMTTVHFDEPESHSAR